MKKLFFALLPVTLLVACNNEETTKTTDNTSSPVTTATDNVDGNIPDSSNAITLNKPLPTDSSTAKDSVPR